MKEKNRLEKLIEKTKKRIEKLPEGKFIFVKNGKYSKWYNSINGKHHYISKANRTLAEKLAYKKLLTAQLSEYHCELNAIKYYLENHLSNDTPLPLDHPDYVNLLSPYYKPISKELDEWVNCEYERNTKYQESLSYKTASGHIVRSKSEMLIDMTLSSYKIPFRYECALHIDGYIYYPDFTIRHPKTGELYYWEHFGMMEDDGYRANAFSKLNTYSNAGIIPGINLITTYETQEVPLNSDLINRIIEYYFL